MRSSTRLCDRRTENHGVAEPLQSRGRPDDAEPAAQERRARPVPFAKEFHLASAGLPLEGKNAWIFPRVDTAEIVVHDAALAATAEQLPEQPIGCQRPPPLGIARRQVVAGTVADNE